jgi:hypothetical protein
MYSTVHSLLTVYHVHLLIPLLALLLQMYMIISLRSFKEDCRSDDVFFGSGGGFFKLGAGSGPETYIRSRSQFRKKSFRIRNALFKNLISFFEFFFSRKNFLTSLYRPKSDLTPYQTGLQR